MPIQALDGCSDGETSCEGGGAEFSCSTAWGEDGANGDVFDELGVDAGALYQGFEGAGEEVGALGVLEATLATLCDGCSERTSNDDL